MGLRQTVANAVQSAFTAIGDVKVSVTYQAMLIGGYSPASDTAAFTLTEYILDAVKIAPTRFELAEGAEPYTLKLLFRQADLPVTPKPEDTVVIGSETFQIADDGIRGDPADATWTIRLMRP